MKCLIYLSDFFGYRAIEHCTVYCINKLLGLFKKSLWVYFNWKKAKPECLYLQTSVELILCWLALIHLSSSIVQTLKIEDKVLNRTILWEILNGWGHFQKKKIYCWISWTQIFHGATRQFSLKSQRTHGKEIPTGVTLLIADLATIWH